MNSSNDGSLLVDWDVKRMPIRRLGRSEADEMIDRLQRAGIPTSLELVRLAYKELLDVEARSLGRVAGRTINVLEKVLVCRHLLQPKAGIHVLEIGALFGLFSVFLARVMESTGPDPLRVTCCDLFAGEQVQCGSTTGLDPTGVTAKAFIVAQNWRRNGLALDDLTLVEGDSTTRQVQLRLLERSPYTMVVIDGDHSYAGVGADLALARELNALSPTTIVLDDVGSSKWTGVSAALEDFVSEVDVSMLTQLSSIAVLRFAG